MVNKNNDVYIEVEKAIFEELIKLGGSGISYKELLNKSPYPFSISKEVIRKLVENGKLEILQEYGNVGKRVYPVNNTKNSNKEREDVIMKFVNIEIGTNNKKIQGVMVEKNSVSIVLVDVKGNTVSIPTFQISELTPIRDLTPQEAELINTMFKASEQYSKSMEAVSRMVNRISSEKRPNKKEFLKFDLLESILNGIGYKNLLTLTRRGVIVTAPDDIVAVIKPMSVEPITFDKKDANCIAELLNSSLGDHPVETFYNKLNVLLKEFSPKGARHEKCSNRSDTFNIKDIFVVDGENIPKEFEKAIKNGDIPQALGSIISAVVDHINDSVNSKK